METLLQNLDDLFHMWRVLYDKNQDTQEAIEKFFHDDYTQCINGVTMNRNDYTNHVIEQKNNLAFMNFKPKNHLAHLNELFVIYDAEGQNLKGEALEAEVIAYVQFKDLKVFKIHGQVHLSKGDPLDVDMD